MRKVIGYVWVLALVLLVGLLITMSLRGNTPERTVLAKDLGVILGALGLMYFLLGVGVKSQK